MREYAKVTPYFWIGRTGRSIKAFGVETQLTALYLLTCPHATMLGIYYLPIPLLAHEIGISIEKATQALENLCEIDFCTFDSDMEYIWVHEMAIYQIGSELKLQDNRVKAIQETYDALPVLSFLPRFFEKYHEIFFLKETRSTFDAPLKPLQSQRAVEQEQRTVEQEQKSCSDAQYASHLSENTHLISLPLNDGNEFVIEQTQIYEWQKLYPNIDVEQTLRNILAWNLANPKRRKTKNGILKHINSWLAKEQQSLTRSIIRASPTNSLFEHNKSVAQEWLNQNEHQ